MKRSVPSFILVIGILALFTTSMLGEEVWYAKAQHLVSDVEEEGFGLKFRRATDAETSQEGVLEGFNYYGATLDSISQIDNEIKISSTPVQVLDGETTRSFVFRVTLRLAAPESTEVNLFADFSSDLNNERPEKPGELLRNILWIATRKAEAEKPDSPEIEPDELTIKQNPDLESIVEQLRSKDPAEREKAMLEAASASYFTSDKDVNPIRIELLRLVRKETEPSAQAEAARTLSLFFTNGNKVSPADLEMIRPLLEHPESEVHSPFWGVFSALENRPSLTPEMRSDLLSLVDHELPEVRLEALKWLMNDPVLRESEEERQSDFAQKARAVMLSGLDSSDPTVRQLCIYSSLRRYPGQPEHMLEVLGDSLNDEEPGNRFIALNFLEDKAPRDRRLHVLAPQLMKLFKSRRAGGEELETFSLARVLYLMGSDSVEVESFLLQQAKTGNRPVLHLIMETVGRRGATGRTLVAALMEETALADWPAYSPVLKATGLPAEKVPELLTYLERARQQLHEIPNNFDLYYLAKELLVVLARSSPAEPERTRDVLRSYLDVEPQNPKVAAIYAVAELFPGSQIAADAAERFGGINFEGSVDPEIALLAADRLKKQSLLVPFDTESQGRNVGPLLKWILDPEGGRTEVPPFVESFERGYVYEAELAGSEREILAIQLRWLVDHPQKIARPGLELLVLHPDEQIAGLAASALSKID